MSNSYKVDLGISLNQGDLAKVKTTINNLENSKKINLEINKKKIDSQLNSIRKQIQNLSNIKINLGSENNSLQINTEKLDNSLKEVASSIKVIKHSLGTLDSGGDMKSLVTSVNQISTALDKASGKFDELNAQLNVLSKKDFSVNFGFNMGKSASQVSSEQGDLKRNAISQLKQQAKALEDYLDQYYKVAQRGEGVVKLTQGTSAFSSFWEMSPNIGNTKVSLKQQVDTYKQYINLMHEAAKLKGVDISGVTSGFSKSTDNIVKGTTNAANGIEEVKQAFKGLFGSGVDGEKLSGQLDSIVADLKEVKIILGDLSSGTSLGGLTQSFDRLSDSIENLLTNAEKVKGVLNTGSANTGMSNQAKAAQESANAVVQSEEKKQRAYKETSGVIDNLKTTLETMRVDRSSIDTIVKDMEELGFTAKNTSVEMKNGKFDITVNGIDDIGRAITEIRRFDSATDEISLVGRKISQPLVESDKFVKKQKKSVADLTNQINQLNRSAIDQNANRPIKNSAHLDILEGKYNEVTFAIQRMGNASSNTFDEESNNVRTLISEYKSLIKEFRNAENVSTKMKGTDFGSGLDIAKNDLEKFKAEARDFPQITSTVKELDRAIEGVGDAASLNKFNDQLRVARSELAKVKSETAALNRSEKVGINTSGLESKIADLQRISPEIDKFETEIDGAKVSVKSLIDDLQQVKTQGDFSVVNARFKAFKEAASAAGIAVTEVAQKAKSINDIKIKISDTGFNGFEQEVLRARNAAEELEGVYPDLEVALKRLNIAMEDVYSADQAGDVKRLVAANEEYEASLKQVYSQLKLYQQAEQKAYKAEMLNQKKSALSSEMETWLKENTRAARDFGEEIRRLQASLNGLDDKGVKLVGQQFKAITKQAQAMGKTGLTTFDRLKSKIKEYSSYLSAAELFMYAEQAMRSMFEQVKLIDSAMTELKKVTDETDASYNQFLSNAASRSKELGTTIDGLVSSTADFARLGYEFEDAQGLAEVANIYAVVGDEIEGVEGATESLILTMAAFKGEMNGMSNTDFAMSIIDKFNEIKFYLSPYTVMYM